MDYLKKHYFLYILLASAVILTLIFRYGPMYGAIIAFKDFSPIKGIMGSEWVGLYNFEKFLSSPNFEVIFLNTLKLSFFGLILSFPIPILLALMLNQIRRAGVKRTFNCSCMRLTLFLLSLWSGCCLSSCPQRDRLTSFYLAYR